MVWNSKRDTAGIYISTVESKRQSTTSTTAKWEAYVHNRLKRQSMVRRLESRRVFLNHEGKKLVKMRVAMCQNTCPTKT